MSFRIAGEVPESYRVGEFRNARRRRPSRSPEPAESSSVSRFFIGRYSARLTPRPARRLDDTFRPNAPLASCIETIRCVAANARYPGIREDADRIIPRAACAAKMRGPQRYWKVMTRGQFLEANCLDRVGLRNDHRIVAGIPGRYSLDDCRVARVSHDRRVTDGIRVEITSHLLRHHCC